MAKEKRKKKTTKKKVRKKKRKKTKKKSGKKRVKKKKKSVKKKPSKRRSSEERILRNFFLILGGIIILVFLVMFSAHLYSNFTYEGVEFKTVREGELVLYQTSIPVKYNGESRQYNFYLRNDPRKLDSIPFEGGINFLPQMVLNSEQNFNCDGDGVIGVANLVQLYQVIGAKVIKDENSTCDSEGRYLYVNIIPSAQTKVIQTNQTCYDIHVADCEILKATEKYLLESFVELNDKL